MNKFVKYVATGFTLAFCVTALSACQKNEGPAERAGKSVDNAAEKTGEQVEKAGEKMQDAAQDAKK